MMDLNNYSESCCSNNLIGRVSSEHKNAYKIFFENNELPAGISGKFRNACTSRENLPAVGDFVEIDLIKNENKAIIQAILPRKSKFSRKVAGNNMSEQITATNIDTAFIVCALNYDFNLRRIERYLSLVWQSGANPVIVLTKADLCPDVEIKKTEVYEIAFGTPVYSINNLSKEGVEPLEAYCGQGSTVVLLGSSGAGKSSLINNLIGYNRLKVQGLRKDIDKGQHTTTSRQMFVLPQGGFIIDTPGMRELQLWDAEDGVEQYFDDIETLTKSCRFNNCSHKSEPGCAVIKAIEDKNLDIKRFENYMKMQKELAYLSSKQNQVHTLIEKEKQKKLSKIIKNFYKD